MVTAITVKEKIQGLIAKSNNTTGNSDTTLTDAVNALVEGYGAGSDAIIEPITITENGIYPVPQGGGLEFDTPYVFKNDLTNLDLSQFMTEENLLEIDFETLAKDQGIEMPESLPKVPMYKIADLVEYELAAPEDDFTTGELCPLPIPTDMTPFPQMLICCAGEVARYWIETIHEKTEWYYHDAPPEDAWNNNFLFFFKASPKEEADWAAVPLKNYDSNYYWDIFEGTCTGRMWENLNEETFSKVTAALPATDANKSLSLDTLVPLFEGVEGGKVLDGWGDITVNVASSDKKVLQYGKFAKFKDNITDQMFEEYVAQATPVVNDPFWGDIYLLCLDESRCAWLISNNPDVGGWTIMDAASVRMYMTGQFYNEETDTDVEFRGWWERLSTSSDPVNYPVCAVPSEKPAVQQFEVWPDENAEEPIFIEFTKEKISATPEVSAIFFEDVDYRLAPPNSFVDEDTLYIACPMGDLVEEYVLQEVNDGRVWATIPKTDDYMEVDLTQYNIENTPGWNVGYLRVGAKIRTQWSANVRYNNVIDT